MNENEIIGNNLRIFRKKFGLSQQDLADYLGILRETENYYEKGKLSIPSSIISKAAKLFGISEYSLYEKDCEIQSANVAFAFKADQIESSDLVEIANFRKIVFNYIQMKKSH